MRMGQFFVAGVRPKDVPAELAHHLFPAEPGDLLGHFVEIPDLPAGVDHKHPFGKVFQNGGVGKVKELQGGNEFLVVIRFLGEEHAHKPYSLYVPSLTRGLCASGSDWIWTD